MTGSDRFTLLREDSNSDARVTFIETFFDLVYVFAVTQLASLLEHHLGFLGAFHMLILLLAVWWAWVCTAWVTNWFDPDTRAVRIMLLGTMVVSLVMSAALPEAFGAHGLIFALAYVVIQGGRSLFAVLTLGGHELRRNFERILAWIVASGAFWIAGAFIQGTGRELVWLLAIVIDYAGPAAAFYTPGLGRSETSDLRTIMGGHLAERCQLFVIIAFGELILDTGLTLSNLGFTISRVIVVAVAFAGSVALWWLYFDRSAEAGSDIISGSEDPGQLGRTAYTYYHLPMVAGIIVSAVADELAIAHPGAAGGSATIAIILIGPALFLFGHTLFKYVIFHHVQASRVVAIVALGLLAPFAGMLSLLALTIATTLIEVAVVAWESRFTALPMPDLPIGRLE
ncbi:MAG TPA: low temperature requirement protein A [Thermomicrobiaceae bacterium]|nr:low temperature requirement protein A [Thermomicrobiaceae bacterium]